MPGRHNSSTREFATNVGRHLAATILVYTSGLILSVWVARVIGPREMGSYSYALWLLGLATLLVTAGVPTTVTKYTAEMAGKERHDIIWSLLLRILPWQLGAAVGLALILLILGIWRPLSLASPPNLPVLATGVPLLACASLLTAFLQGQQRFLDLLKINVASALVTLGVMTLLLALRPDASTALLAIIVASVVQVLMLTRAVRRRPPPSRPAGKLDDGTWRRFLRYTAIASGIALADAVVWRRSEVFFLRLYAPLEEIAFYSIAFGLLERAQALLPSVFAAALLPSLAHSLGREDHATYLATHETATKYLAMAVMPLFVWMATLASPLVELIYGTAYRRAAPILQILLLTGMGGALATTASTVLYARERHLFILTAGLLVALVNISLDLWLIPKHGAIGAAVANGASQLTAVTAGVSYLVIAREMTIPWKDLGKVALSTGIMAVGVAAIAAVPLPAAAKIALALMTGVLVYVPLVICTGLLSRRELSRLRGLVLRRFLPPFLIRAGHALFDRAERYAA